MLNDVERRAIHMIPWASNLRFDVACVGLNPGSASGLVTTNSHLWKHLNLRSQQNTQGSHTGHIRLLRGAGKTELQKPKGAPKVNGHHQSFWRVQYIRMQILVMPTNHRL